MRKSFSFLATGPCERTGLRTELLCIFVDVRTNLTESDLFDELKTALRMQSTHPDGVVVIADQSGIEALHSHWMKDTVARESFQSRSEDGDIHWIKTWQFARWQPDGSLVAVGDAGADRSAFVLTPELMIKAGLHALVERNPVLQWAPGGHAFKHPSGTVNKVFAQGRELAASEAELAFLGCALTHACPPLRDKKLDHVLIDTMGIYPVVKQALDFIGRTARVDSFHSYSDLSTLSVPRGAHVVVISASTSGGMAKRLIQENEFSPDHVITLVDRTRSEDRGETLIALDEVDSIDLSRTQDGTETQIELIGEHFTFRSKPPRGVVIGVKHLSKGLTTFLKCLGADPATALNKARSGKSGTRLLSVDGASIANLSDIASWLEEEVRWRVPASIDSVIFVDSNGSEAMARKLASHLQEVRGGSVAVPVLSVDSLSKAALSSAKGVAVVQSVAGDGGVLREVSRDLREFAPNIPRYFLVGLGTAHSAEVWTRLRQFLVQGAKPGQSHGFSNWVSLPLGAESNTPVWKGYAELGARMQTVSFEEGLFDRALIEKSIDLAANVIHDNHQSLLPSPTGASLALTEGFVFFPANLNYKRASTATVFLTVAAVLQQAREMEDPSMQLRATGYESVVLAPENFHRFNDSILQACILRAALPSELDYSSSPELSGVMAEFLAKVFKRHEHPYGEAGLEFAIALLSRRMRLVEAHAAKLREELVNALAATGKPSALLGFMFLLE